jgi:hypothetical protein
MTCGDVHDTLIDYLYGELDPDAARAVDEHARGCDACAAALEGLTATLVTTRSALQGPLDQRPPARVAARVRRQARRAGEAWPVALMRACVRWLHRPLLLPVLGAAAMAVLGITLQIRSRPDLRERYALVAPPSSASPPEVRAVPPAPEPTPHVERAPAAEDRAASADRVVEAPPQSTAQPLPRREYAVAPPPRGASEAPAADAVNDGMRRADELGASNSRTARQPRPARNSAAARKSAGRASAVADRVLAETDGEMIDDARLRAAAAPTSDLRAELGVEAKSEPSAAPPAAPSAVGGIAAPELVPAPALRPLLQRAERAFRNKRWGTAAGAYRQLLHAYPTHASAPAWKRRLGIAETALEARGR